MPVVTSVYCGIRRASFHGLQMVLKRQSWVPHEQQKIVRILEGTPVIEDGRNLFRVNCEGYLK